MIPKRERRERLIKSFDSKAVTDAINDLIWRHGLSLLTDEAIEILAGKLATSWRWTCANNRRNRAIYAARKGV